MKYFIFLIIILFQSTAGSSFDLQNYYQNNKYKNKDDFFDNFPYNEYLSDVQFTDFYKIQKNRKDFFKKTLHQDGDIFLYYLFENFLKKIQYH